MKLLVIIEKTRKGYSAYAPDLPGCIAAGPTRSKVEKLMQRAMTLHLEALRADGARLPEPHTYATVVEVAA